MQITDVQEHNGLDAKFAEVSRGPERTTWAGFTSQNNDSVTEGIGDHVGRECDKDMRKSVNDGTELVLTELSEPPGDATTHKFKKHMKDLAWREHIVRWITLCHILLFRGGRSRSILR